MILSGKVVVVTGGASGIGRALVQRIHGEGAQAVIVGDLDGEGAERVARSVDGIPIQIDVSVEADIQRIVRAAEDRFGRIDLFCSNAGFSARDPDLDNAASAPDAAWTRGWGVNVMAHIYAARAALPRMIERQSGYFLNTVSAAGLLSQIGSAVYSTTKHAAIGFGESLAITHRQHGIGVSLLCPQAVDTPMIVNARASRAADGVLTPDYVADFAVRCLAEDRFMILPHPQVLTYMQRKSSDYDRWLEGMARLRLATLSPVSGAS